MNGRMRESETTNVEQSSKLDVQRRMFNSSILPFLTLGVLAVQSMAVARTTFEEFQARKSPEIARQASALARWAVECHLKGIEPRKPPIKLDRIFTRRAGVFVTMNRRGKPRGCWGSIEARHEDVAMEIIDNAIGAATADVRQKPLGLDELSQVTFCISIIGPLRPAHGISDLAPGRLGLLVRHGSQEGMLLPGEAKTARWQMAECKRKANLPPGAQVEMYVFRTVTLEDKGK